MAVYCGKECQRQHWKYHKSMCQILGLRHGTIPSKSMQKEEEAFWNFFRENEEMLYKFDQNQQMATSMVSAAIKHVHPSLVIEFDSIDDDGRRPLIISGDGDKEVFPAVESLYRAAPAAEPLNKRWKFLRYRQRVPVSPTCQLTYDTREKTYRIRSTQVATGTLQPLPAFGSTHFLDGGRLIVTKATKVYFKLFMQNNYEKIGIMLFIDGIDDNEMSHGPAEGSVSACLGQIGFLWLDTCLGEYDVEMHVGLISFFSHESEHFSSDVQPIFMLAEGFDQQLEWNRRHPSLAVRPDGDPS